jgi:hypothetical protein
MFADMLESLAGTDKRHNYLETGSAGEIAVQASIGEYPEDWLID